jgi:hypothetical protein
VRLDARVAPRGDRHGQLGRHRPEQRDHRRRPPGLRAQRRLGNDRRLLADPASLLRAFSDKLKAPADPAEGKNAAAVDAH